MNDALTDLGEDTVDSALELGEDTGDIRGLPLVDLQLGCLRDGVRERGGRKGHEGQEESNDARVQHVDWACLTLVELR